MAELIREEVSGIGPMSKRTDLNVSNQPAKYISGLPYGQGEATYDQQTAAPMAGTTTMPEAKLPPIVALDEQQMEADHRWLSCVSVLTPSLGAVQQSQQVWLSWQQLSFTFSLSILAILYVLFLFHSYVLLTKHLLLA